MDYTLLCSICQLLWGFSSHFVEFFLRLLRRDIAVCKGNFEAVESPRLWACNVESRLLCCAPAHFRVAPFEKNVPGRG